MSDRAEECGWQGLPPVEKTHNRHGLACVLKNEVRAALDELDIHLLMRDDVTVGRVREGCRALRSALLREEVPADIVMLSRAESYYDLTPKYRLDILLFDIPMVADNLAVAIAEAELLVQEVCDNPHRYIYVSPGENLFWNQVDHGVRLVSSGWGRIALLLDLALGMKLEHCTLRNVLKMIRRLATSEGWSDDADLRGLQAFFERSFGDLEKKGRGAGARHEAVHVMLPSTRVHSRFMEERMQQGLATSPRDFAREYIKLLVKHHGLYLRGIEQAGGLVSRRWRSEDLATAA